MEIKKIKLKLKEKWDLVLLMFLAGYLRLVNLGYSDFQGDEIKALFIPGESSSIEFFLTQRKGPIQFFVTFLIQLIDPTYSSRLFARLPFAIAGLLAVLVFYKLVKLYFDRKIAFLAAFFIATNGFFIAFSRIVQYQSFVILFMLLSLYLFALSVKETKYRVTGVILGFIFWGLSVLSHYDGIFIVPVAGFILLEGLNIDIKKKRFDKDFLFSIAYGCVLFLIMLALFYVPFVLAISEDTKSYWLGRLSGTGGKISSSRYLFQVYQPIYVVHIYTILFGLGIFEITKSFIFRDYTKILKYSAVLLWFGVSFVFMELLVNIPGTHIYTYLVPVTIVVSLGIQFIYQTSLDLLNRLSLERFKRLVNTGVILGVTLVFTFIFLQSEKVFVDHETEYPWTSEKFLVWEFPKPTPIFHLSMFGFPYYRHWDEIGDFVGLGEAVIDCPEYKEPYCSDIPVPIKFYSTNERKSIARYHISYPKDTDSAGYFVYIIDPQSFTPKPTQEKAIYWSENYEPVKIFYNNQKPVAYIYFMPPGSIEDIKDVGY